METEMRDLFCKPSAQSASLSYSESCQSINDYKLWAEGSSLDCRHRFSTSWIFPFAEKRSFFQQVSWDTLPLSRSHLLSSRKSRCRWIIAAKILLEMVRFYPSKNMQGTVGCCTGRNGDPRWLTATSTVCMRKTCNSAFRPFKGQKKNGYRLWEQLVRSALWNRSACSTIPGKNSAASASNWPKAEQGREGACENRDTQQGGKLSRRRKNRGLWGKNPHN